MSAPDVHPPAFCPYCGQREDESGGREHSRCQVSAEFEPPRYCRDCGRRMVVQVNPIGWTARCVAHGERRGT